MKHKGFGMFWPPKNQVIYHKRKTRIDVKHQHASFFPNGWQVRYRIIHKKLGFFKDVSESLFW